MKGASGGGGSSGILKAVGKIGAIATGIGTLVMLVMKIVSMTVSASPMLQQMLKLFNFGIMLILRPIGDFFGFFLRPIMIYFLRNVALPWVKFATPIMQKLGTKAGKRFVENPLRNGAFGLVGFIFSYIPEFIYRMSIMLAVVELKFKKFITWIKSLKLPSWEDLALIISTWIASIELPTWEELLLIITTWIESIELPTWEELALKITEWISSLFLPDWNRLALIITTWIESLKLPSWEGLVLMINTWMKSLFLPDWGQLLLIITTWINGLKLPSWEELVLMITTWVGSLKLPTWDEITSSITSSITSIATAIKDFLLGLFDIFGLGGGDDSNNSGNNNTNKSDGESYNDMIFNYINEGFEDISSKLSDAVQGGR